MNILRSTQGLAIVALVIGASVQLPSEAVAAEQPISFGQEIAPVFQRSCLECHQPGGEGYEVSGLDLRTYEGLMKGTKYGPMVVPGDPFVSNLMVVLEGRASPSIRMPFHGEQLRPCYVRFIRRWIAQGANDN